LTGILGKAACALTLGALVLGATMQTAQAQSTSDTPQKPFAVKIGVFTPINKEVRTASGNFIASLEGDVVIQRFPERSSVSLFSIGYLERSGLRLIPITVSQIFRDPNNPSGRNYYYGLGVGVYSARLERDDTSGRVKNLLGGFGVVGLELSKSYFIEGKYHVISRYDNKNINGVQVSVGLHF
jgi:hypothetical protein